MIKERRVRHPPRVPAAEGIIILHGLSAQGTSLLGWLEDNGLDRSYQRTADNIIYGKITGKNSTKTASGGTSRALMLLMSDSFGIQWDWAKHLTPIELDVYRKYLVKMKATSLNVRVYRKAFTGLDSAALMTWLNTEKKGIIRMVRKNKLNRVTTFFRTCVKNRLCPVCFQEAAYSSEILANSKKADSIRTKSVLTCIENGCNSGLGIDIFNILEVIDPNPL